MSYPRRLTQGVLPEQLQNRYLRATVNALAAGSQQPQRHAIVNPATGAQVGFVYEGAAEDVEFAFARAREAQPQWAALPARDRASIILDFHDRVMKHRELLMDIVQAETGKNRLSALDEVLDVASNARFYGQKAPRALAEQKQPGALPFFTKNRLQHHPKGVVGQISPWNYPLALAVSDAIPALLAGNAVVAKPDQQTPFSALAVADLLAQSGLPRNVFQIVTGDGPHVGDAIARQCDYLMFTGSTATGRILGKIAGERLIGYSAELGGKNPLIIAADANIEQAVREAVFACFANSGQLCVSIERIYVERSVATTFIHTFREAVGAMRLGVGPQWGIDMGSLISATQLERVQEFVDDALSQGAEVLCGGRARPDIAPYFFEPTVLVNVPESARLYREEVFGPVVFIEEVDSLDAAIEAANDTDYGLNAAVFAAPATGWEVAARLEAGGVGINDGYAATWASVATPLGGVKQSGLGRRHGIEGLLKYTEPRNIAQQRGLSIRGPRRLSRRAYASAMTNALSLGKKFRLLP